ncbi:MAG: TIGR02391 family protein [Acidobacteriota bacterium]
MKKIELLEKLKLFKSKLEEHKKLYDQSLVWDEHLGVDDYPGKNIKELESQRKKLNSLLGVLRSYINEYSVRRIIKDSTGMQWDVYLEATGNNVYKIKGPSLDEAIMDLEGIIAKVGAEAKEEIDIVEYKNYSTLFELMKLHPIIIKASSQRFQKALYSDAIREAFKAVENYVKEKSGKDDFGASLMSKVFRFEYDEKKKELKRPPILQLNKLETISEKDEQEGYKFLFMGAMKGIRNPFSHEHIEIKDPIFTIKLLCLAILLLEILDASLAIGINNTK